MKIEQISIKNLFIVAIVVTLFVSFGFASLHPFTGEYFTPQRELGGSPIDPMTY